MWNYVSDLWYGVVNAAQARNMLFKWQLEAVRVCLFVYVGMIAKWHIREMDLLLGSTSEVFLRVAAIDNVVSEWDDVSYECCVKMGVCGFECHVSVWMLGLNEVCLTLALRLTIPISECTWAFHVPVWGSSVFSLSVVSWTSWTKRCGCDVHEYTDMTVWPYPSWSLPKIVAPSTVSIILVYDGYLRSMLVPQLVTSAAVVQLE